MGSRASNSCKDRTRRTRSQMAGGLLRGLLLPEGDHSRDLPLVPHLVHLCLEVPEVLFREMCEASLLQQVFAHRLSRTALDDGLRLAVMPHDAVLDLVEREDAG